MCQPLLAEGEFAELNHYLLITLEKSGIVGDFVIYTLLADIAAQQRDAAALRAYVHLAVQETARVDHSLFLGIARRSQGVAACLTGDYTGAQAALEQALGTFQNLKTEWQAGRTLFELGELALARGDPATAFQHFVLAQSSFENLQAAPALAQVRARINVIQDRGEASA